MPSACSSAVLSGETAAWRQPYVDVVGILGITNRGKAAHIGCGPTAWAVVYKYWQDNKGINFGLADSYEYNNQSAAYSAGDSNTAVECMIDLADLMDTFYSTNDDNYWGATLPAKMKNGIKYATQNGYSSSTVDRDSGTEASKFANVINYIGANKPVILYICSDGVGFADHYVVIEGVYKKKRTNYTNAYIWYKTNYCWGSSYTNVYIVVYDYGRNEYELTTSNSCWLIDVK